MVLCVLEEVVSGHVLSRVDALVDLIGIDRAGVLTRAVVDRYYLEWFNGAHEPMDVPGQLWLFLNETNNHLSGRNEVGELRGGS